MPLYDEYIPYAYMKSCKIVKLIHPSTLPSAAKPAEPHTKESLLLRSLQSTYLSVSVKQTFNGGAKVVHILFQLLCTVLGDGGGQEAVMLGTHSVRGPRHAASVQRPAVLLHKSPQRAYG